MDAAFQDIMGVLGMIGSAYLSAVLIRRIFIQRNQWLAEEADAVVTGALYATLDAVLDRFCDDSTVPTDMSADLGLLRLHSQRALLGSEAPGRWQPAPEGPVDEIPADSFDDRIVAPVSNARARPSCSSETAPAPSSARFDRCPLPAEWLCALGDSVKRFTGVCGHRPLSEDQRESVQASALAAMQRRLPFCPRGILRYHVQTAYCRAETRLSVRLCTDYFRFCAVAAEIR